MKLREATIADFAFVEEHTAFPEHFSKEPNQYVYTVAVEQDKDVIAVGGIMLITPACAWCWCDITTFVEQHKIELVRNMRSWIDIQVKDLRLNRLQCWVDPLRSEAIRLVQHLGFTEEYEMKNFLGPDKSAMMYVRMTGV